MGIWVSPGVNAFLPFNGVLWRGIEDDQGATIDPNDALL